MADDISFGIIPIGDTPNGSMIAQPSLPSESGPKQQSHQRINSIAALESPPDPRDWIFENLAGGSSRASLSQTNSDETQNIIGPYPNATASKRLSTAFLPAEYDMRKYSTPSRDQANRATCASIVAAEIKEIQTRMAGGINATKLSSEYIYYHRGNKPSSGMYGRDAFSILQKCGTVEEEEYPYQAEDNQSPTPSKKLIKKATRNRICNYARIKTLNGIKRALYEVGPCYLFLPLYTSRPEFWRPDEFGTTEGHAICVLGWTREGLILKNSWGPDWNGDGCIILPYEDYNVTWECWVAIPIRVEHSNRSTNKESRDSTQISSSPEHKCIVM